MVGEGWTESAAGGAASADILGVAPVTTTPTNLVVVPAGDIDLLSFYRPFFCTMAPLYTLSFSLSFANFLALFAFALTF